jgi:pilus assembly protein CpaC
MSRDVVFFLVLLLFTSYACCEDLIQINVQVVEVKLSSLRQLGIKWPDSITFAEGAPPAVFTLGEIARLTHLTAILNFLIQQGNAKILANPNLVVVNGGKAAFQVGGEIPYLVGQSLGQSSVEWKPYGVQLEIYPKGDRSKNTIYAKIKTVVSNLDYTNSVRVSGYAIPAISLREAESEIEASPGTTILIAGLKYTSKTSQEEGLPIVSKIPLIGYLFKAETAKLEDTELNVFITPAFVSGTTKK